ncbi:MAG: CoA transferase [Dehalococcoidia bacterium]
MSDDQPLPLRGVRVIDFCWIVAGPQATRILADFGADVIRVEYEGRPDSIRLGMRLPADSQSLNVSPMFNNFNRNKRSMTLNLHHPDGRAVFEQLIMVSDVVIENFSATVMERLGWTWEAMAAINPGIIYVSLSGFGHTGRDRSQVTWGPTAQAVSGLTAMSGLPGHAPAGWGYSCLDHRRLLRRRRHAAGAAPSQSHGRGSVRGPGPDRDRHGAGRATAARCDGERARL